MVIHRALTTFYIWFINQILLNAQQAGAQKTVGTLSPVRLCLRSQSSIGWWPIIFQIYIKNCIHKSFTIIESTFPSVHSFETRTLLKKSKKKYYIVDHPRVDRI